MKIALPEPVLRRCCWRRDGASSLAVVAVNVALLLGALGGGYASRQIRALSGKRCHDFTQQRCKTVYDKSRKMLDYDVTYKIGNQQGQNTRTAIGTRIPLDSNGQLILV